jgi:hypothetical protein
MRRWWPLATAIAYALAGLVVVAIVPQAPGISKGGDELVRYYRQHGDAVRVSLWLATVALIPLVLLLMKLRTHLQGLGRDVLLVATAMYATESTLVAWVGAGLALHGRTLDAHVARTVADIGAYFGPLLTIAIVLMVGGVGVAALRSEGKFPFWFGCVSLVVVVEQSIETITVFGRSGFIAPGGAMNFGLGATLTLLWILCAGVVASRADERTVAPALTR